MASRIFIDPGYAAQRLQGVKPDDVLLETAMESACRMIEQHLNRRILQADYTAIHGGWNAIPFPGYPQGCKHVLCLADPDGLMRIGPVTAISSLTENGTALTIIKVPSGSQPYSTSAGAVLYEREGDLMRITVDSTGYDYVPTDWTGGFANIRVVCTAGWPIASVPDDLKECAREMTWILYKEGSRSGMESISDSGAAIQFIRTLPHLMQRSLNLYSRKRFPITLAV